MNKFLLLIAAAVLLAGLSFGGVKVYQGVRGLRNNNPLNIRKTADKWNGLADPSDDGDFFIFTEVKWGIRAAARILDNYKKAGKKTIAQIINTWAPPVENSTDKYIDYVVSKTGMGRNYIPIKADGDYVTLLSAMISFENGLNPYSDAKIAEGVALA